MSTSPAPWATLEEARAGLEHGTGRGIRIALLDSGIELSHPALAGLRLRDDLALVDQGLDVAAVPGEGRDLFGHGTAIAHLVRQAAPEVELGSFRVLGDQLRSRTALITEGVRQAIARGYHILNCSFGCAREDQVLFYKDWIDEAYLQGRHVIAASNNLDFLRREWPGHFPSVITATFLRATRVDTLHHRGGSLVEFGARGQDLDVAWAGGGRKNVTGSSFAAPHVAALLARMLSRTGPVSPLLAKAMLQQLAEPWPAD
jgi:subtilisin